MKEQVRLVLSNGQWKRIEKLCVGKREDPDALGGTCSGAPMAREIGVPAMEDNIAAVATGSGYVREHLETGGLVAGCQ